LHPHQITSILAIFDHQHSAISGIFFRHYSLQGF
jgi:hypothetical protein